MGANVNWFPPLHPCFIHFQVVVNGRETPLPPFLLVKPLSGLADPWAGRAAHPPGLLMHRLLPHGHVLRVLLQPVQGRVWLQTDPVVMILGVAPRNQTSGVSSLCRCPKPQDRALSPPFSLGSRGQCSLDRVGNVHGLSRGQRGSGNSVTTSPSGILPSCFLV